MAPEGEKNKRGGILYISAGALFGPRDKESHYVDDGAEFSGSPSFHGVPCTHCTPNPRTLFVHYSTADRYTSHARSCASRARVGGGTRARHLPHSAHESCMLDYRVLIRMDSTRMTYDCGRATHRTPRISHFAHHIKIF